MRRSSSSTWATKLCVSIERRQKRPRRHEPLKNQLALNRGKALGYPKPAPPTRQARKALAQRYQRQIRESGVPF